MSMLTTARKFKRRSKSARASLIFGRDFENVWKHASILDWKKNGIKCIMLFVTILCLCSKLKPSYIYIKTTLNGIVIDPELAILPDKLCCIWTATRDLKQRKLNYPLNYQYGIDLQIDRKPFHVVLLILLAGDVATNPGPLSSAPKNRTVNCLSLYARSLTSLHRTNTSEAEVCSNMELFQNLVYSEDSDVIFVNETWLKKHICDLEILEKIG